MNTDRWPPQIWVHCVLVLLSLPAVAQPVITQQPTNQFVIVSNTATFTVSDSGAGSSLPENRQALQE